MNNATVSNQSWVDKNNSIIAKVISEAVVGIGLLLFKVLHDKGKALLPDLLTIILLCSLTIALSFVVFLVKEKITEKIVISWLSAVLIVVVIVTLIYTVYEARVYFTASASESKLPFAKNAAASFLTMIVALIHVVCLIFMKPNFKIGDKDAVSVACHEGQYSVTGTCITFKLSEDKQNIITYMIKKLMGENQDISMKNWMFPGGHAFYNQVVDGSMVQYEFAPGRIAIIKTEIEAGIYAKIFELDERNSSAEPTNLIVNFDLKHSPHYTYLFHQGENAPCYAERGHKYHYDCVFIGEQTDEATKRAGEGYKLATIELNVNENMSKGELANAIKDVLCKAEGGRDIEVSENCYQVYMLLRAYKDYIARKKELGEL